jgi:hypothetical protein
LGMLTAAGHGHGYDNAIYHLLQRRRRRLEKRMMDMQWNNMIVWVWNRVRRYRYRYRHRYGNSRFFPVPGTDFPSTGTDTGTGITGFFYRR